MTKRDAVDVAADALMEAAVEKRLARLRNEIAGVETPAMRGDCLAVVLASDFEAWADEDEETDESGTWKQSAVDACNGVLDAIVARCRDAIRALPAPAPASPWRDMGSAPKDRRIRLWLGAPYSREDFARWYEPWGRWITGDYPPHHDDETYGIGALVPTHWKPESTPPAKKDA